MTNFDKKKQSLTVEQMAIYMSCIDCEYCELKDQCTVENGNLRYHCYDYCKSYLENEVKEK